MCVKKSCTFYEEITEELGSEIYFWNRKVTVIKKSIHSNKSALCLFSKNLLYYAKSCYIIVLDESDINSINTV